MHSRILKVNNASLTGENVDIKLGTEPNHEKLYEAANVARSGCNFTNGTAVCVCFLTGDNTFFGKIAEATTKIERPDSLIKHEIHRLIHFMAVIAFSLGIANKFMEPFTGAVLAKVLVLIFIILFIQKRPRGLFALKGRAVEG